ncbi:transposase [Limosilactobacillus coleohominis]|uniref:transposase n=1 Tax=Limosilactobacillus coleohominis TaxID=181675 RepID=UPI002A91B609|nr:transposase [Limosilactobacillus coleohominis]MDY5628382.1 transposase [Limosilactobacillus coleohominis]
MSLQDDRTLDCIANDNNISPSTVNRYLDQSRAIASLIKQELPINMALGEFRGVNQQLHFICIDNDGNHKIQAILPDRYKRTIENYFLSFPIQERARVKTISMDLNSYYKEIARRLFPNAQIIIDRFHIVAILTRAFNQYRAQVMKRFEKTSRNYRLLKFSWRLYLVSEKKLSNVNAYYDRHIRQQVTSNERVDLGLLVDERLMADYNVMQSIMTTVIWMA